MTKLPNGYIDINKEASRETGWEVALKIGAGSIAGGLLLVGLILLVGEHWEIILGSGLALIESEYFWYALATIGIWYFLKTAIESGVKSALRAHRGDKQ